MGSCKWLNSSVRGEICIGRGKHERRRKREGWKVVTPGKVEIKMDTLRRKGRKQYLSFRKAARSSLLLKIAVEERHFSLHRNKKYYMSCNQCMLVIRRSPIAVAMIGVASPIARLLHAGVSSLSTGVCKRIFCFFSRVVPPVYMT